MKIVVIYRSKSGYTKKYAEWIAEALSCDMKENKGLKIEDIADYDVIIYGGGMYAGGINGLNLIKSHMEKLTGKHLIVWATGCNPGRKEEMDPVWEKHFTKEQLVHIKTFYLRGGFDYDKLNRGDKILMNMLKVKLKKEKNPTEDAIGMLEAYDNPKDFREHKNIEPLITYVQGLA